MQRRFEICVQWSLFFGLCAFILAACTSADSQTQQPLMGDVPALDTVQRDLPAILQNDTLRAIITYSSTSYFIYKGQAMGYEYELLKRLADHLGLALDVVIAENLDEMPNMLFRGEGDLIAHGLTITKARRENLAFTHSHNQTQQVLVQRLPENWRALKRHQIDRKLVRNSLDLAGKEIHVRRETAYYDRLLNLADEIGDDILIRDVSGNLTTEELIEMVALGEIPYTLSDQNIARISQTYFENLDIETPVSLAQQLAWAVRKNSPQLLAAINEWIEQMQDETDYYVIYNKYFKNKKAARKRHQSDLFSVTGGQISNYDSLLKKEAQRLGWDWRLLAAQVYQESQFDPQNQSWAGAQGMMQLMPATAQQFKVSNRFDPEANLHAGVSFLLYLTEFWQDIPEAELQSFVLASYNAGPGHVEDARRLAEKFGKDPDLWQDVSEYLLLKAKPEYYQDEVVKYGYCRGREPVAYVKEILERYGNYAKVIPV